ncbi:MAG: hypothetical protein AB7S26_09400 [Sandaracinaceae bacterium]
MPLPWIRRAPAWPLALLTLSCAFDAPDPPSDEAPPSSVPAPEATHATPAPMRPPEALPAPAAHPAATASIVPIEAGVVRVGSRPGLPSRRPSVEADLAPVTLPAFDIDRRPFPNLDGQPPLLVATRAQAARECASVGRRLCDELEWERACRGTTEDEFPTGAAMDLAACLADPDACASPDGVLELGLRSPEWTASDAGERLAVLTRTAVARGGRPDSDLASHRCGARAAVDPDAGGALAFRCCGGPAPDVSYPDVGLATMFADLEVTDDRWRAILASVPALASFAEGFGAFGETAANQALGRGGATPEEMHWELSRGPFAWSPSPGEVVWIVSGSDGSSSVLAAMYPLGEDRFVHAASFVVDEPDATFAVLRDRATRRELLFSTCWGCDGESGVVRFEDDATLVIVQQ